MENSGVERFERRVLFGIVRWFSLAMGFLGLAMLVIGGFMLVKSWLSMSKQAEVSVTYGEVQQKVAELEKSRGGGENGAAQSGEGESGQGETDKSRLVKKRDALVAEISAMLKKDNPDLDVERVTGILLGKVSNLDDDKAVAFFEGMKNVISQAPAGKKTTYTDSFITVYGDKLSKENSRVEEKRFEAIKNLGTYAYVTITGLMTVVSFGIILILAAIERNTRRKQE